MQRVAAYIDGFNLYFGLRQSKLRRYYWLSPELLIQNLMKPWQTLAGWATAAFPLARCWTAGAIWRGSGWNGPWATATACSFAGARTLTYAIPAKTDRQGRKPPCGFGPVWRLDRGRGYFA